MFIFTKRPHVFDKIVIFKTLFCCYNEINVIMVCKINWTINWLKITDTDTAKMSDL